MTALQWTHYVNDYRGAEGWDTTNGGWDTYLCGDKWQLLRIEHTSRHNEELDYGVWPTAASARLAAQVWEDGQPS